MIFHLYTLIDFSPIVPEYPYYPIFTGMPLAIIISINQMNALIKCLYPLILCTRLFKKIQNILFVIKNRTIAT